MSSTPAPPTPPATHRRRRWPWWVLVVLVLAVAGYLWWRRHHPSPPPAGPPPIAVTVAVATSGSLPVYLESIGTVVPVYTDYIYPQVTGNIVAVHYREGQTVAAGAPLIDIDPRLYAAQVEQAEGALERDQQLLAEAQMDLTRYQQAWARNAIPRQTLEDQEKTVLQGQGTVRNDEGTLHYDQTELVYCHITAPIAGQVGLRLVDPGNLVTAGSTTPLLVIAQMQPITVVFTVSEDELGEVVQAMRHAQPSVQAWDRDQGTLLATGRLFTIDNQIDTTTGTVKLRAQFSNPNAALFPNQFVATRLLLKTLTAQTLLPSSAVQYNGTAAFVYLIENQKAVIQSIKAGASAGGMTVVTGIAAGQQVANSSFQSLQNGVPVKIVATPAANPGGTGEAAPSP